jgi:hypothetical protein
MDFFLEKLFWLFRHALSLMLAPQPDPAGPSDMDHV